MEWGVAALPAANGKFPQISGFKLTVDTTRQAQVQTGSTITTPGQRITSLTLDDGTKIVENGAVVAGGPVNIATTNFTANNGDAYPFNGLPAGRRGRALPAVAVRLHRAGPGRHGERRRPTRPAATAGS